jgi:hypothetical protein
VRVEVDTRDEKDGKDPVNDMEELGRAVAGGENDQPRDALNRD